MAVLDADRIVAALRGGFTRDIGRQAMLRLAADKIRAAGAPYTSVYLYMLHGDELVLEAFAGRATTHIRIPVGTGVCGTAVATGRDQNVPDVRVADNYLARNTWTRSELVVLIRRGPTILGQIDIDSDESDPFTADEEAEVRKVADALAVLFVKADAREILQSVRDVQIFERRIGSGSPVVVLHGGPGAHHDYLLPGFDDACRRTHADLLRRVAAAGRRCRGRCRSGGGSMWPTSKRSGKCGVSTSSRSPDIPGRAPRDAVRHRAPRRVATLALVSPAPARHEARREFERRFEQRNLAPAVQQERQRCAESSLRERDPASCQRRLFELSVAAYFHRSVAGARSRAGRVTGRTQQSLGQPRRIRSQRRAVEALGAGDGSPWRRRPHSARVRHKDIRPAPSGGFLRRASLRPCAVTSRRSILSRR